MKKDMKFRIFALIFIVMVAAILTGYSRLYNVKYDREVASSHWTVSVHGKTYEDVSLSTLIFPNATIGDEVVLSTVLDTKRSIEDPQLFLFTDHAAVELFLDGERIYTEGLTDYRLGDIVPCGNQWIDLPDDYNGMELTIKFYVSEINAFSNIQEIYVVSKSTAMRGFVYELMLPMTVNCFLLTLGFVLAVCITLMMDLDEDWFRLICLSGFSVCVALWSFANTNLLLLFMNDLGVRVRIEYTSLYLEPLLFILYFHKDCMRCGNKSYRVIYNCLAGAQAVFVVVAIAGQIFHFLRYPTILSIQHIILVAMFVFLCTFIVHCLRKHEKINKILIAGLACIFASGSYDLIMYNLKRFFSLNPSVRYRGVFSIGTLIFVVCLVLNYIVDMMEAIRVKSESAMYEQMAHSDALTGLANRRKMEETFDDIERLGDNFCVVSFDLNWLKRVNDNMGHDVGDAYLKAFAEALRDTFRGVGSVFRVGGDEFVAILRGNAGAEQLVTMLNAKIQSINEEHKNWDMSVAAGAVCSVLEPGLSVREAYRLADERMYINKKEMKAVRED